MKLLLIFLFYISILGWAWGDSLASKNNEGNKLYKNGKIDEALSKWRDAQIENPDNDKLHYNIGNGLHEQKKYEDAFKEYEKSLNPDVGAEHCSAPTKDNEFKANTYYNMGNTHYRMGKLLEAIEDYKKCLDIDPNDEDAKYNIEFVRKKIKENLKKEDQQQKESQQKENKDKEQQKQNESSKSQEKQQEEQKQSEEQKSEEAKDKEKADKTKEESGEEEKKEEQRLEEEKEKKDEETSNIERRTTNDEKGMSKEDAVRLLDALKDDEKDVQKELKNQPIEGQYRVDKDW
ncbi:MAG: hypothetical protein AUJ70_05175 [Candidatus Omnitrophica bacterium CG1_02_40_15]|nr:MAG: hypothetical protein AUJ70_05175 [Candidatus Omnitrophica bacterium CG1_02_40_15]